MKRRLNSVSSVVPTSIQRPCKKPGCRGFAEPGTNWCAPHQAYSLQLKASRAARLDAHRGSAAARGYGAKWQAYARTFRARFPISPGYLTPTEFWGQNLARQFHALRAAAAAAGQFAVFLTPCLRASTVQTFSGAGLRFLAEFPIYAFHPSAQPEPSAAVDHIVPVSGPRDPLFWVSWNHQALSHSQHSSKTASHDGGFRAAKPSSVPSASAKDWGIL